MPYYRCISYLTKEFVHLITFRTLNEANGLNKTYFSCLRVDRSPIYANPSSISGVRGLSIMFGTLIINNMSPKCYKPFFKLVDRKPIVCTQASFLNFNNYYSLRYVYR